MVVAEAVQQPVNGEQPELGGAVRRLGDGALDGDRDVADPRSIVRGKGEHIGRRVDAQETRVEVAQLPVAGQPEAETPRAGTPS